MSENNAFERKNLFLNPKFVETGRQPTRVLDCAQLVYQWDGRCGFAMRSMPNRIGPLAEWVSAPLEAGKKYVFRIEIGYGHNGNARGSIVSVSTMDYVIFAGTGDRKPAARVNELRFTARVDGPVLLQFRGVNTDNGNPHEADALVAFYDPQLELAETYDAAKTSDGKLGPLFFHGDTMARGNS